MREGCMLVDKPSNNEQNQQLANRANRKIRAVRALNNEQLTISI
jgi:hypothetical protein